jgi:hypothetical protein
MVLGTKYSLIAMVECFTINILAMREIVWMSDSRRISQNRPPQIVLTPRKINALQTTQRTVNRLSRCRPKVVITGEADHRSDRSVQAKTNGNSDQHCLN